MAKHSANILEWARQGAEARWQQLQAELASLVDAFPHLTGASKGGRGRRRESVALSEAGNEAVTRRGRGCRRAAATATAAQGGGSQRKRSKMTAAQKKAVSLRMKKYWADRRKAAAKA
jgi:hypothetical protein